MLWCTTFTCTDYGQQVLWDAANLFSKPGESRHTMRGKCQCNSTNCSAIPQIETPSDLCGLQLRRAKDESSHGSST